MNKIKEMKYEKNNYYYPWLEKKEDKIIKQYNDKPIIRKLKIGVASERAFNFLRLSTSDFKGLDEVSIEGDIDYKIAWIVDVIAHVILTQNKNIALNQNLEDVDRVDHLLVKRDIESFNLYPFVTLTVDQINQILGKTKRGEKLSKKEVDDLVKKLLSIIIDGTSRIGWDPVKKEWVRVRIQGHFISEIRRKQVGEYWSKKFKIKKEDYVLVFNTTWGKLFLKNLLNRTFIIKPRKIYSMSRSAQCIYNFLILQSSPVVKVKITNLQKIIGLKSSDIFRLQIYIESGLNALKDNKLISGWDKEKKGIKTVYLINNTKMFI